MKLILCEGDSWTSGDMINPKLDYNFVNHPDNDSYRLPKVWPYKLGKLLKTNVVNNAAAGSSNDAIVRRTTNKVLELLESNKAEDLFVIVGWSSPERKDFYQKENQWVTIYPAQLDKRDDEVLNNFTKVYVEHFWNEKEYISRFINQNLYLHYFLKYHNVKHYFFESFWEQKNSDIFVDNDIVDVISKDETNTAKHFLKIKDEIYKPISFRRFIMRNFSLHNAKYFNEHHPTEQSHQLWAEELYKDLV